MARLRKFRAAVSRSIERQWKKGSDGADIVRALRDVADQIAEKEGAPTDADKDLTLRNAARQFDLYAVHHAAKTPPQFEKANVNVAFRDSCLRAAGEKQRPIVDAMEQPAPISEKVA